MLAASNVGPSISLHPKVWHSMNVGRAEVSKWPIFRLPCLERQRRFPDAVARVI